MKHTLIAIVLATLGCSSDKETPAEASESAEPDKEEVAPEPEPEPEPPPPEVVERIALLDKVARDPQKAEKVIASFAGLGAPAVAPLVARIEAAEELEKIVYVSALARVGEPALEPLTKYLSDSDLSWVHVDICNAFARLGPKARSARAVVAERAEHFAAGIKKACSKALAAIDK